MRHVLFALPLRVLGALVVTVQLAACGRQAPLDFVVIVIDTLRADRLGAYGSRAGLTPHLDALAARSVVFERAYAQSSWTNPSVASLLTSRYQSQHGITNVMTILPESESTLPEVFWLHGYATGAFTANAGIAIERGFSQGYQHYVAFPPIAGERGPLDIVPVRAPVVNAEALEWLDERPADQPFFLWLQYMEPHFPYVPNEPPPGLDGEGCPHPVIENLNVPEAEPPAPAVARAIDACYDAEVREADAAVGVLLDELRRRGRLEHTVVVVTSDHGEEILEHGRVGHGLTLFEEVIRVPLIVSVPWREERLDVDRIVRLIDVAPSLVDLAGIRVPKPFEGRSFAAVLEPPREGRTLGELFWPPAAPEPRGRVGADASFSELLSSPGMKGPRRGQHLRSLVESRRKMIVPEGDTPPLFYDLGADPRETGTGPALDLADRQALEAALAERVEHAGRGSAKAAEDTLDDETRRQLEMLGYIE